MLDINVKDYAELDQVFNSENEELVEAIYTYIKEASSTKKKSADLFRITVGEADYSYEVSVPKEEWPKVLQTVLDFYHARERSDECIDVWQLIQETQAGNKTSKKVG